MRAILIDESSVFREGLKTIMSRTRETTIIGEADTFPELLEKIRHECERKNDQHSPISSSAEITSQQ